MSKHWKKKYIENIASPYLIRSIELHRHNATYMYIAYFN
jgi:hypothetical protein